MFNVGLQAERHVESARNLVSQMARSDLTGGCYMLLDPKTSQGCTVMHPLSAQNLYVAAASTVFDHLPCSCFSLPTTHWTTFAIDLSLAKLRM